MRFLELDAEAEKLRLTKDFYDEDIPAYAILSHTWGQDDEEVTYKEMVEGSGGAKRGFDKLRFCRNRASRDGLRYFWVDTCCIDKTNNNELSEAINSMFQWYRGAARCYVYLSDVSLVDESGTGQLSRVMWEPAFRKSSWFTRGWTLQELIAPNWVVFYSRDWIRLGDKTSLQGLLQEITGIPGEALQGRPLLSFSIEQRLSWSEARETKRVEDNAYSLLGIFGIHLPLLYGEGKVNAFRRLHEEIQKLPKDAEEIETQTAALLEDDHGMKMSPKWLKPVVILPSQAFAENLQATDPSIMRLVIDCIIFHCRTLCYEFYHSSGLWRTRYGKHDPFQAKKLFELENGAFPVSGDDFSLRVWLGKLQRAIGRINESDTVHASDLYDYMGAHQDNIFRRMVEISSIVDHRIRLNTEDFEECFLLSLQVCRHLNGWESLGRLKILWERLHSSPVSYKESKLQQSDFRELMSPTEMQL